MPKRAQRIGKKPGDPLSQVQAARILKVSREHLNRVIKGKFRSPTLLATYHELQARHAAQNPITK